MMQPPDVKPSAENHPIGLFVYKLIFVSWILGQHVITSLDLRKWNGKQVHLFQKPTVIVNHIRKVIS